MDQSDPDDEAARPPLAATFATVLQRRLSRRRALTGFGAGVAGLLAGTILGRGAKAASLSTLTFRQPPHKVTEALSVADGYRADVLIRWGDKVLADAPAFDPRRLSADAQEKQFGYNNDFIAFMPLPLGSAGGTRGLLCVNHEYTNAELMWPGVTGRTLREKATAETAAVEMAAHGHSVIEIEQRNGRWHVVDSSRYARRISLRSTDVGISGPAAGHSRMKTTRDSTGKLVRGILNNCAGGVTPWGTVLVAEENFNLYFAGEPEISDEAANHRRYGVGRGRYYAWEKFDKRFDVTEEPNEPNRFGWMVEYDPYDPASMPMKRTALGRFKHEGATTTLTPDGRVVAYSGDDQQFECLYRFVSAGRFDPKNRAANKNILDDGILSVARFNADGTLDWLNLVFGRGPLTPANGFRSQADVLIETRRAADLLGATPMDRPEDVETNSATGRVYVMLTNNSRRTAEKIDAANPRGPNRHGHVVELLPPGTENGGVTASKARHDAPRFRWEIVLLAGDPKNPDHGARYHPGVAAEGAWLSSPDNCAFDNSGRLWIATDQGTAWQRNKIPDGVYACDLAGPGRALTRLFLACPVGAEAAGPCFTPDGKTLFLSVQHPGEGTTFDDPSTRWPDFKAGTPPRPSVVAITKIDGGEFGS